MGILGLIFSISSHYHHTCQQASQVKPIQPGGSAWLGLLIGKYEVTTDWKVPKLQQAMSSCTNTLGADRRLLCLFTAVSRSSKPTRLTTASNDCQRKVF